MSTDVERLIKTLVSYRVKQVQQVRIPLSPKDVYVPSFFMPVLSAIGRFEDPSRALRLTCEMENTENLMEPDEVREYSFMLSSAGVKCDLGLPRELTRDEDGVFRVYREDKELFVAGADVGDLTLLIRTIIDIEFKAELFGQPRTKYVSLDDSITAWDAILGLALA